MKAQKKTSSTHPERILISERKDKQRRAKEITQRIMEAAGQLAPLYAALDLGAFDRTTLADAYKTGGQLTHRRYLDHAKAEAVKIESAVLRHSILASFEANTPPYFAKAKEIQANAGMDDRYYLGYITVTDSGAILTNEDAERLVDDCREYITDPELIAKYRQHEAAVNALNALFEDGRAMPLPWFSIFAVDGNGKISIPEDGVNYAYLLHKRTEAEATGKLQSLEAPTTEKQQPPRQQNRKENGVIKGITKEPDRTDPARLRHNKDRPSPDAI